ncbi:MAG: hypothetical protein EAY75_07720 [Bacteroidetes bacterium]|nr:MAG: hypothetical protein EAY75_07720 [Bacteroidota bacterium]
MQSQAAVRAVRQYAAHPTLLGAAWYCAPIAQPLGRSTTMGHGQPCTHTSGLALGQTLATLKKIENIFGDINCSPKFYTS